MIKKSVLIQLGDPVGMHTTITLLIWCLSRNNQIFLICAILPQLGGRGEKRRKSEKSHRTAAQSIKIAFFVLFSYVNISDVPPAMPTAMNTSLELVKSVIAIRAQIETNRQTKQTSVSQWVARLGPLSFALQTILSFLGQVNYRRLLWGWAGL